MPEYSLFNFPVSIDEVSYNIKWTILKIVQRIVTSDTFKKYENFLDIKNDNFTDTLMSSYSKIPTFACDFIGIRDLGGTYERVFQLEYSGRPYNIEQNRKHGIMTTKRELLTLHDSLELNFRQLSERGDGIEIFRFTDPLNEPVGIGRFFSAVALESTFPGIVGGAQSRENGLTMSLVVMINTQ